jgi:uncharacterized membrane protein YkoI
MHKINKPAILGMAALGIIGTGALTLSQVNAQTPAPAALAVQTADTNAPANNSNFDPAKGGHVGVNGVKEVLLTGTDAEKAKAAALTAVSGGTVERVETDAEGATYEAHMTKSDGTHVTVKFDSNFNVRSTDTGR